MCCFLAYCLKVHACGALVVVAAMWLVPGVAEAVELHVGPLLGQTTRIISSKHQDAWEYSRKVGEAMGWYKTDAGKKTPRISVETP